MTLQDELQMAIADMDRNNFPVSVQRLTALLRRAAERLDELECQNDWLAAALNIEPNQPPPPLTGDPHA